MAKDKKEPEIVEEDTMTNREKILAARKKLLQRQSRQKLPKSLR